MKRRPLSCAALLALLWLPSAVATPLVVLTPEPADSAFGRLAAAIAAERHAPLVRLDPDGKVDWARDLRRAAAPYAIMVLPAERVDQNLLHRLLRAAVAVDDDPFLDLRVGLVTGRDAERAATFWKRTQALRGPELPTRLTYLATAPGNRSLESVEPFAVGRTTFRLGTLRIAADDPKRESFLADRRAGLAGNRLILLTGHGAPEGITYGFQALDLRDADLSPAVVVNCACLTGSLARVFWARDGHVRVTELRPEETFALAVLESGASGYFAGVGSWHGILAIQAFCDLLYDGATCGDAAKAQVDRMTLEWDGGMPEPADLHEGDTDEGLEDLRQMQAGVAFYGDPTLQPVREAAGSPWRVLVKAQGKGWRLTAVRPPSELPFAEYRSQSYYEARDGSAEVSLVAMLPTGSTVKSVAVPQIGIGAESIPPTRILWGLEQDSGHEFLHLTVLFPEARAGTAQTAGVEIVADLR